MSFYIVFRDGAEHYAPEVVRSSIPNIIAKFANKDAAVAEAMRCSHNNEKDYWVAELVARTTTTKHTKINYTGCTGEE